MLKVKIELPYDPATPFLGIYPEKMKTLIQKDTCTQIFIAALFTITKTWKQPKCLSTDNWLKKMKTCDIYTHTHRDTNWNIIKESEMLPCAVTWMALDIIRESEVSQRKTSII